MPERYKPISAPQREQATHLYEADEPSERESVVDLIYKIATSKDSTISFIVPLTAGAVGLIALIASSLIALGSENSGLILQGGTIVLTWTALAFYFGVVSRRLAKPPKVPPKSASVADMERSVEMLTASDMVTRLAGIYALESIARRKLGGREAAVDVLSAFVRERSKPRENSASERHERVPTDVLEAVQALSRLNDSDVRINLRGAYLPNAELAKLDLSRADLSGAILDGSDLSFATLDGATLEETSLRGCRAIKISVSGAVLHKADLTKALVPSANFSGALLSFARLVGVFAADADFSRALLGDADLTGIDLRGAILVHAYLGGADLTGAQLQDARLDGVDLLGADLTSATLPSAAVDDTPTREG